MQYALINESNNVIENMIELEPDAIWAAPQGYTVRPNTESKAIGDVWENY